MQIPPGKVGPTPAFFQALQGSPRPVEDAQAAASPSKETGRDIPRGSFLDIRA